MNMKSLNEIESGDLAWAAGFLDGTGSIVSAGKICRLTIRTVSLVEATRRFASILGIPVATYQDPKQRDGAILQITGDPLHEVMKALWPLLTDSRKRGYAQARRRAAAFME